MTELTKQKCKPCEGGVDPLSADEAKSLHSHLQGWEISSDSKALTKRYEFKNFKANMAFLNRVADVAEDEGHHPDFCVNFNKSDFKVSTHAIGGLSENDFILAAKIDQLLSD